MVSRLLFLLLFLSCTAAFGQSDSSYSLNPRKVRYFEIGYRFKPGASFSLKTDDRKGVHFITDHEVFVGFGIRGISLDLGLTSFKEKSNILLLDGTGIVTGKAKLKTRYATIPLRLSYWVNRVYGGVELSVNGLRKIKSLNQYDNGTNTKDIFKIRSPYQPLGGSIFLGLKDLTFNAGDSSSGQTGFFEIIYAVKDMDTLSWANVYVSFGISKLFGATYN